MLESFPYSLYATGLPPIMEYRKILIINPQWVYIDFVLSQELFWWAYFRGGVFSERIIIGGSFAHQKGLGLSIKTALNTNITTSNS